MALPHIDFLAGDSVLSRRGNSKYVDTFIHVLFVCREDYFLLLLLACTALCCASC
jgi:hypothetical protein